MDIQSIFCNQTKTNRVYVTQLVLAGAVTSQIELAAVNHVATVEIITRKTENKTMNNLVRMFPITAISIAFLGMITPAAALQDWTTVPAACAGTDNNFFSGTPSASFPVARFITRVAG